MSPEIQEKVRIAVEQGHVADEDWAGVSAGCVYIDWLMLKAYFRMWSSIVRGRKECTSVPQRKMNEKYAFVNFLYLYLFGVVLSFA